MDSNSYLIEAFARFWFPFSMPRRTIHSPLLRAPWCLGMDMIRRRADGGLVDINCYIWKNPDSYCKMKCACCGEEMLHDRESEKMVIYKCTGCGLTDSKLKA